MTLPPSPRLLARSAAGRLRRLARHVADRLRCDAKTARARFRSVRLREETYLALEIVTALFAVVFGGGTLLIEGVLSTNAAFRLLAGEAGTLGMAFVLLGSAQLYVALTRGRSARLKTVCFTGLAFLFVVHQQMEAGVPSVTPLFFGLVGIALPAASGVVLLLGLIADEVQVARPFSRPPFDSA